MIMGEKDFCDEARVWLRRFGGNLYTLLPYAADSWDGFERNVIGANESNFKERFQKLGCLIESLQSKTNINDFVVFDPPIPHTNMVHVYLKAQIKHCEKARDIVVEKHGVSIFSRLKEIPPDEPLSKLGYGAKFEWTIGNSNGSLDDDLFVTSWTYFIKELKNIIGNVSASKLL